MKEETKKWLNLAKDDYATAKFNFDGKKYRIAAFLCQQSAEKALKAILLEKTGKIEKIHDLVKLGNSVGLNPALLNELKELTSAYIYSRYPDAVKVTNLKKKVYHFLQVSDKVLKWTGKKL